MAEKNNAAEVNEKAVDWDKIEGLYERKKLTGIFDAIGWAFRFLFEKGKKRWLTILKGYLGYILLVGSVGLPLILALVMSGFISVWTGDYFFSIPLLGLLLLIYGIFVSGFSAAYFTGLYVEVYNDRAVGFWGLVKRSWKNQFKFLKLSIIVSFIILGGIILLIVPGVIWSITYAFVMYVMYENSGSASEAMEASKKMTQGYKWELFKKWAVAGLLSMIVSGMLSGMAERSDSLLMSLISLAGSVILGILGPLVTLKYYYELKN